LDGLTNRPSTQPTAKLRPVHAKPYPEWFDDPPPQFTILHILFILPIL